MQSAAKPSRLVNRNSLLLIVFLFFVLATPNMTVHGVKVTCADFCVPVAFLWSVFHYRKKLPVPSILAFAVYVGWCFVSIFAASLTDGTLYFEAMLKTARVALCPMIGYILYAVLPDVNRKTLLYGITGILALSCIGGIFGFVAQYSPLYSIQAIDWDPAVPWHTIHRAGGIFRNSGDFGFQSALFFGISVVIFNWKMLSRKWAAACVLISIIGIALSMTRINYIAFALLFGMSVLFWGNAKDKLVLVALVAVGLAVSLALAQAHNGIGSILSRLGLSANKEYDKAAEQTAGVINHVSAGRLDIWLSTFRRWLSGPWNELFTGTGFKVSNGVTRKLLTDNMYIMILCQSGIIGFTIFLVFAYHFLREAWHWRTQPWAALLMSLGVNTAVCMLTLDAVTSNRNMLTVFILLAMASRAFDEQRLASHPYHLRPSVYLYCDCWQNGGVEAYIMNLLREWDLSKTDCSVVTAQKATDIYDAELLSLNVPFIQVLHKESGSPVTRIWRNQGRFRAFLREHPCDVLYLNLSNAFTMRYAKSAREAGIPVRIVHSHCAQLRRSGAYYLKRLAHEYGKHVYASSADAYFACSDLAAKWMFPQRRITKSGVLFVPNAIDTARFRFQESGRINAREALKLKDRFVLGNVGRFVYQKNHPFLLRVFAGVAGRIPNAVLLLIGDGEDEEAVRAQAKALGIADRVIFYGKSDDVPPLLWAMDVFLLPSHFEGLPVSAIEAQAAGLRCLLSNQISTQCKITEGLSFLPISDPSVWVEAVMELKDHCSHTNTEAQVTAAGFSAPAVGALVQNAILQQYREGRPS